MLLTPVSFDAYACADMTQAYMNGIEAVLLRKRLLETIYETEIVQVAYRAQASAYNRDIKPENPVPIEFVHPSDVEGGSGRGKAVPLDEVSSLGADFATRLALLEYDVQLAGFDFQTVQVYICIDVYIYTYMCVFVCVCVYIYIYIYI